MTQEEIIRMAREAGFKVYEGAFPFEPTEDKFIGFEDNLERFAALVAAHERKKNEQYKKAYKVWQDKTEWVQETAQPKELGMHRADVLRQRIENLQNAAPVRTKDLTDDEVEALAEQFVGQQSIALCRAVIAADREKNK